MTNLEITSLILLIIGLPMLFGTVFVFGIVKIMQKIMQIEPLQKIAKRLSKINNRIEKSIENFILGFFLFGLLYVFTFPIVFILMLKYWLINKNTAEMTGKEGLYLFGIHFPLLLIWFAGFCYLLNYFFYGNY